MQTVMVACMARQPYYNKTYYVVLVSCAKCGPGLNVSQQRPKRTKMGPQCPTCRVNNGKRTWKARGTIPAPDRPTALKLAQMLRKPKPRNRRRCYPASLLQRTIAEIGRSDMATHRFKAALIDAPDQRHSNHKIRVLESASIDWYQDLAEHYGMNDHPGSGRKRFVNSPPLRKQVEAALDRIIEGWIDPVGRDLMLLEDIEISASRRGWESKDDNEAPF